MSETSAHTHTRCLLVTKDSTAPGQQVAVVHRDGCEGGDRLLSVSRGLCVSVQTGGEREREDTRVFDIVGCPVLN